MKRWPTSARSRVTWRTWIRSGISADEAAKQMENAAERAAEIAAGLQQLEVGMTKKSTVRKVPFKRGGEKFSLRKKIFNSAERGDKGNKGFTRAPATLSPFASSILPRSRRNLRRTRFRSSALRRARSSCER